MKSGNQGGFSLLELIVAIGIFSVLMAIVTTLFIRGIKVIRVAEQSSGTQVQQQNAMEWMSRLVRYIDNPVEGSNPPDAITYASTTSLTFTTFSGTGPVDRVPYKVNLSTSAAGVSSQVWTPDVVSGSAVLTGGLPTFATPPMVRILVATKGQQVPSMRFSYRVIVSGVLTAIALADNTSLNPAQMKSIATIDITITDPASPAALTQTVYLVNGR